MTELSYSPVMMTVRSTKRKSVRLAIAATVMIAVVVGLWCRCHQTDSCGAGNPDVAEAAEVDWRARRMEIRKLRLRLDTVGVLGLAADQQTPDTAPLIHSRYWVDRLPRTEIDRRACELEVREFGLDVVRQLEKLVLSRKISRDAVVLEDTAEGLLRLSEWLSTAHGYGNYRLKRWTELIALNVI